MGTLNAESRTAWWRWGVGGHILEPHPLSIPNPHPSQRSPGGPLGAPSATSRHSLKTVGFALKGPFQPLGEEKNVLAKVKSQELPSAVSGEPDSVLGWGTNSARTRQPLVTTTTTKTILLPLKFLEQLAGGHKCT